MNMTMFDQGKTAIGSSFPNLKLESAEGSFHLSDYQGRQNVVLHFVCHFSCSRCWRSMMRLGQLYPSLQGLNTTVMAIGTNRQFQLASQLAQELDIPFPLFATTTGAFHGLQSALDSHADSHFNATILLDANGIVHHGQFTHSPTAALNVNALLPAVAHLRARQVSFGATGKTGFRQASTGRSKAPKKVDFYPPCLNVAGYGRPCPGDDR
jgi:peroxiredoxin